MLPNTDRVGSGVGDLDALLGGLILGDNVVWVLDRTDVVRRVGGAQPAEGAGRAGGVGGRRGPRAFPPPMGTGQGRRLLQPGVPPAVRPRRRGVLAGAPSRAG